MANKITFGLSDHDVGREEKGVYFFREVEQKDGNKKRKGKLLISKGGLRWFPKFKSKTNYFLDWQAFENAIKEKGKEQK